MRNNLLPEDLASECLKRKLINMEVHDIMQKSDWTKQARNRKLLEALRPSGKRGFKAFYEMLEGRGLQYGAVLDALENFFSQ